MVRDRIPVESSELHLAKLTFSHALRETKRAGSRPGLRIVGFERRVTIAFSVDEGTVTILRLFYGGQDWEAVMTPAG